MRFDCEKWVVTEICNLLKYYFCYSMKEMIDDDLNNSNCEDFVNAMLWKMDSVFDIDDVMNRIED